jgi:uncharacterized protein YndB with AHSA1/START domain
VSDATPAGALRTERIFDAPIEVVFDAWTTAEVLREWWHVATSWETPHAEVDARVGGAIRATMRNPSDDREYGGGGEFTVIERPARLAFTWRWHDAAEPDEQLIEVEFADLGDGRTKVVLTNSGLRAEEIEGHREGWSGSLDNLAIALRR